MQELSEVKGLDPRAPNSENGQLAPPSKGNKSLVRNTNPSWDQLAQL